MNSPAMQRALAFVRHPNFALVIGGVVACLAFLILVSFAALSWVSSEGGSITALGIWLGGNDNFPSLAIGNEQGFAHVRFVDRLLILIPLAAIALITIATLVIMRRLPTDQGLVSLVVVALFLLAFPYIWKGISTDHWRGDLLDGVGIEELTALYNTVPHTIFSFLAVVVSLVGTALYFADQHGLLPNATLANREPEPTPSDESV